MSTRGIDIAKSWAEFDKQYELIKKFGHDALVKAVQEKKEGVKVDRDFVLDVFTRSVNEKMDNVFSTLLTKANKLLQNEQVPRGDQRPEVVNENVLGAQQQRQFIQAPWMKTMDLAADPRVAAAATQIANQLNKDPNAPITSLFDKLTKDAKMENKLKQELKMRLAPKMSATRKLKRE